MKSIYTLFLGYRRLSLLWLMVLALPLRAQTIPDVQWSTSTSQGLAIRTDGTIATTDNSTQQEAVSGQFIPSRAAATYALAGNRILFNNLFGITQLNFPSRPFFSFFTSLLLMTSTTDNRTAYIGNEYNTGTIVFRQLDANGNNQVVKSINTADFHQSVNAFNTTVLEDLTGTPDGGYVLLITSAERNAKTVVFVRKYDAALNIVWTKSLAFPTPNPATPDRSLSRGKTIINTPDGGYLLAGFYNTTGNLDVPQVGWVAKLNSQGDVVWQKLLDGLPNTAGSGSIAAMQSVSDAILAADGNGYALAGTGIAPGSPGSASGTSIVELNADGSFKRARALTSESTPQSFIARYTSGGQGYYAVGTSTGGQPLILLVNPATLTVAIQRTFSNSPALGALTALAVAGDRSLVFNTTNNALVKLRAETSAGFTLLQPTYNCQTGAITFTTNGGDGSPITYSAPGIMRASSTSNSGTVEAGLRGDPKTIPITGTQNGQSSTVIFDLAAFCSFTPQPPLFALLAPTYNCQTGAITFNISGGNGSPVTYSAPGIMRLSPTSNAGTVEPGLRADPKTIPITAIQSGQTSSLVFDLPGLCGRQARIGSPESGAGLQIVVLGNPTTTAVMVAVSGVGGQALRLELLDSRGSVLAHRSIGQAGEREVCTFELGQQSGGLFLVRAVSGQQTQTVKVVKQ